MHKLFVALFFISIFLGSVFVVQNVGAVSNNVVIYQVQAGGAANTDGFLTAPATREFISIYNNSDQEVDITDWCLLNKSDKPTVCFNSIASNIFLHLPGYSYVTIASDNFAADNKYIPDFTYKTTNSTSGTIIANSDSVKLIDANGILMDDISWDSSLTGGNLYQRNFESLLSKKLIDTGSLTDFSKISTLVIPPNKMIEEFEVFDACKNIAGVQNTVPAGYLVNNGVCSLPPVDICSNIDGVQTILPIGFMLDDKGYCIKDQCLNMDGLQLTVPDDYIYIADFGCMAKPLQLKISELLPNAIGSDEGNEFIEIFNPNSTEVNLLYYLLFVGPEDHFYSFPVGTIIKSGQYMKFSNDDIKFTLLNSSSFVRLKYIGDFLVDETSYINPPEGQSWALIDDVWQYTNQLTPAAANLPMLVEADVLVIKSVSILKPCKDGQYRSEETGRCRNIISDVAELTQCAEGQERNPATNRCRSTTAVLSDSDLKPCDPGQERNPETNRCRNVVSEIPKADYAPEQTSVKTDDNTSWLIMAGIGAIAIGYGIWEWRTELLKAGKKVSSFLRRKK